MSNKDKGTQRCEQIGLNVTREAKWTQLCATSDERNTLLRLWGFFPSLWNSSLFSHLSLTVGALHWDIVPAVNGVTFLFLSQCQGKTEFPPVIQTGWHAVMAEPRLPLHQKLFLKPPSLFYCISSSGKPAPTSTQKTVSVATTKDKNFLSFFFLNQGLFCSLRL